MTPIDQIKEALDVDEYASRYVTIRAGKTLCFIHREKTPSLAIHKKYFKCHGCGTSGDIITFAAQYHGVSTGEAISMLADELGIPLTRQPQLSPYDAIKAQRLQVEAMEWRRLTRLQMIESDDYETSVPFLEDLDSMTRHQILTSYQKQRTPEQAAMLRQSAADQAKPTVESLVKEFLQWSR